MDPRGGGPGADEGDVKDPLLHFVDGARPDRGVQRKRGPDVGEAELSLVHFIAWAKKYWGKEFVRWLLTSVDTDLWMIVLLAMSTGHIQAEGEQVVDVSVCKVTGGVPKYIWVNRVFTAICDLKDGGESAWPAADFAGWVPDRDERVRLFVLVYLLSGCDFLPAISGLPFSRMCAPRVCSPTPFSSARTGCGN